MSTKGASFGQSISEMSKERVTHSVERYGWHKLHPDHAA